MKNQISTTPKKLAKKLKNFCKQYAKKSPALSNRMRSLNHHGFIGVVAIIVGYNNHAHLKGNLERDALIDVSIDITIEALNSFLYAGVKIEDKPEWQLEEAQFKATLRQFLAENEDDLATTLSKEKRRLSTKLNKLEKDARLHEEKCNHDSDSLQEDHIDSYTFKFYIERHNLLKGKTCSDVLFDYRSIPEFKCPNKLHAELKEQMRLLDDIRNALLIKKAIAGDEAIRDTSFFYAISISSSNESFAEALSYEAAILCSEDSKSRHMGMDMSFAGDHIKTFHQQEKIRKFGHYSADKCVFKSIKFKKEQNPKWFSDAFITDNGCWAEVEIHLNIKQVIVVEMTGWAAIAYIKGDDSKEPCLISSEAFNAIHAQSYWTGGGFEKESAFYYPKGNDDKMVVRLTPQFDINNEGFREYSAKMGFENKPEDCYSFDENGIEISTEGTLLAKISYKDILEYIESNVMDEDEGESESRESLFDALKIKR